jgi:hypothetical protein
MLGPIRIESNGAPPQTSTRVIHMNILIKVAGDSIFSNPAVASVKN